MSQVVSDHARPLKSWIFTISNIATTHATQLMMRRQTLGQPQPSQQTVEAERQRIEKQNPENGKTSVSHLLIQQAIKA